MKILYILYIKVINNNIFIFYSEYEYEDHEETS